MESEITIGQECEISVPISPENICQFSELSGDFSPIHTDINFAKTAGYDGPLVHGAFLAALVSRLIGMHLPGRRGILERMDLSFRQPCYAPCQLLVKATVKQVSEAVNSIILEVAVERNDGAVIVTGKTWHKLLD